MVCSITSKVPWYLVQRSNLIYLLICKWHYCGAYQYRFLCRLTGGGKRFLLLASVSYLFFFPNAHPIHWTAKQISKCGLARASCHTSKRRRSKQCATITKIYNKAQPIILHTHHLVSFTIVTLLNIMSATSRIEYSEKYADETHEYRYVAIRLKS
jgi:hypothetical protein